MQYQMIDILLEESKGIVESREVKGNRFIYLCIVSDALFSSGASSNGVAIAEKFPPLSIHSLHACSGRPTL